MKHLAVAIALICAPGAALAGDRVWSSHQQQGISTAHVVNAEGVTLRVDCPEAGQDRVPTISIASPGLEGGENKTVLTLITVGGRSASLDFRRRVLEQNEVVYTWDATAQRPMFDQLLFALTRGGRTASVVMRTERFRQDFPLQGARAALEACAA